jgi:hypothetical protein
MAPGEAASHPVSDESARRRRTSQHLIFSIMAVLMFGSALGALYWTGGDSPTPLPTTSASPSPTPTPTPTVATVQPTVLIQANSDSGAEVNLLTALSVGDASRAIVVSLQPDLMVSAPGVGSESIRTTVSSIDTLRAPAAVSATLGVRVDGSWRLDRKALAGLVDAAGGMTVRNRKVIRVRDASGDVVLRVRSGKRELTGAEASWYAVGQVKGQSESEAMARGLAVFEHSLGELPDDTTKVRETLTSLGALAPTTIGAQALAEYLVDLGEALRSGSIVSYPVPTTSISIGESNYHWVDFNKATPKFRKTLPWAQWNTAAGLPPRVLVRSGTGQPGWIGSTRVAVEGLGYVFVDGRGTPSEASATSSVTVRGIQPWGQSLALALGLPEDSVGAVADVTTPPTGQPWADVDVVLQSDYVP